MRVEADEIVPGLFIGSRPPERLREHGFDLVVLCALEDQRQRDIPTITVGLIDTEDKMDRADITRALHGAQAVNDARSLCKRVLVTCQAGVNRSSLVVALSLVRKGWTAAGAIDRIREKRKPPIGMRPLENRMFVKVIHNIASGSTRQWLGFRGRA